MPDKILLVDDNIISRKLLIKALARDNFDIVEAANGREALDLAAQFLPDLVLLDIVLPELDGYQVCQALKADPRLADIPVIFLSAKAESEDKIKGLEIGGVDYITKPFNRGEVLARVQTQLKIRHLMKELLVNKKYLDEDLRAAAVIQASLLPQKSTPLKNVEIAWKFLPCDLVGGDIFNVVRLDENHLAFYLVDVSGHGVPGAMVTVSVSQSMQPQSGYVKRMLERPPYYEIVPPREVLARLDEEYPLERFNKYFTMVYLVLDLRQGRVIYSNAAHPPPVLLRQDGGLELLEEGGAIIGLGGLVPFQEEEKWLQTGDKLVFYTDGVTEYQDRQGNLWGAARLLDFLSRLRHEAIGDILNGLCQTLQEFGREGRMQDDVSLLGFEFTGPGTS